MGNANNFSRFTVAGPDAAARSSRSLADVGLTKEEAKGFVQPQTVRDSNLKEALAVDPTLGSPMGTARTPQTREAMGSLGAGSDRRRVSKPESPAHNPFAGEPHHTSTLDGALGKMDLNLLGQIQDAAKAAEMDPRELQRMDVSAKRLQAFLTYNTNYLKTARAIQGAMLAGQGA